MIYLKKERFFMLNSQNSYKITIVFQLDFVII